MNNPAIIPYLQMSISIFVLCFAACAICGLLLFYVRTDKVNDAMKHPYLQYKPFKQLPFTIRATILLDYYLHLVFPKGKFWVIGQANYLLQHVDPARVPKGVKWMICCFWGACWLGLINMAVLWGLLSLT